jgi:alkaline phosphatase D
MDTKIGENLLLCASIVLREVCAHKISANPTQSKIVPSFPVEPYKDKIIKDTSSKICRRRYRPKCLLQLATGMAGATTATTATTAAQEADFVLPGIPRSTTTVVYHDELKEERQQRPFTTKLAFGSCHKAKYADARIWSTIAAEKPLAFLWTGDAIYPPVRDIASVEQLQAEYQRLTFLNQDQSAWSDPTTAVRNDSIGYYTSLLQPQLQRKAKNQAPNFTIFGTWDDHDYGGNDRGADMPDRPARADAYWAFLNRTRPATVQNRSGLYYSVVWTEEEEEPPTTTLTATNADRPAARSVQVIFLDTRWHRQGHCLVPSVAGKFPLGAGIACLTRWLAAGLFPNHCRQSEPDHAVLGAEQWTWLQEQLLLSSRHVNATTATTIQPPSVVLIVSSIQVLTTNPAMESWGQFPRERDRLVALLQSHSRRYGSVVTVLSGDVHHGEILTPQPQDTHEETPFVEVTSSGLTHDCSKHIYGYLCRPLLTLFGRHRRAAVPPEYYIGRNYGTVTIDWANGTTTTAVQVQVHDVVTGATVLTTGWRSSRSNAHPAMAELSPLPPLMVRPCMDGHLLPVAWSLVVLAVTLVVAPRLWKRQRAA